MDPLQHIISRMKREEIRAFKMVRKKVGRSDERKLSLLFDLLRTYNLEKDTDKILAALFPNGEGNMNAFYRLKNRLKNEVEKFLLHSHSDLDERVETINLITLASIFTYKSEYELSLLYLRKAEKLAQANEYYELLDLIYNQIIALGHMFDDINLSEYNEKISATRKRNAVIQEANMNIANLSYTLRRTNFNKGDEDVTKKLERIYDELKLSEEMAESPALRFKTYQLVRDILLHKKDFHSLQEFLIHTLDTFDSDGLFTKANHTQKIKMITWIVNTMSINKTWGQALTYSELLHEELLKFNKLYYDNYIWTYYQALVTNYMSTNRLDDAIRLLEDVKELHGHKGQLFYDYAIHVNLSLCYYFKGLLSMSIRTLSFILVKDVYPRLSPELQFSVSMLEILLHFEQADYEFVSYKIAELKRLFKSKLKQPQNIEDALFIRVVNGMANKPGNMRDRTLSAQIKAFMEKAPDMQVGSGRHVEYKLWVKSKLERRTYYSMLLESLEPAEA